MPRIFNFMWLSINQQFASKLEPNMVKEEQIIRCNDFIQDVNSTNWNVSTISQNIAATGFRNRDYGFWSAVGCELQKWRRRAGHLLVWPSWSQSMGARCRQADRTKLQECSYQSFHSWVVHVVYHHLASASFEALTLIFTEKTQTLILSFTQLVSATYFLTKKQKGCVMLKVQAYKKFLSSI